MESIISSLTGADVVGLVSLMAANIILSIAAAIKNGVFAFGNLGDFVPKRVLPLIAYLILAVLATSTDGYIVAKIAVYAGLVSMYGAGIARAVESLTGIKIPNIFAKKAE